MNATITVNIGIDSSAVEREGRRAGLTLDKALIAVISRAECRIVDSVRHMDGIASVGSDVKLPKFRKVEG